MASDTASRKPSREKLATLMTAAMVSSVVNAVYEYQVLDPTGLWPFSQVASAGSMREQFAMGALRNKNRFGLTIMSFVPNAQTEKGWTPKEVEDKLDAIDKAIADVIADNRGKKNDATLPWN